MAPKFIQSLVPRREKRNSGGIIPALKSLTFLQLLQFFTGWLAWTCDAFDFFCVSLSVNTLAEQFDKQPKEITTAITLTLLFRSIGAVVFGILSDRFGRKWPLVANLLFCCSIEIGTSFVQTYNQFLAIRALFGVAMGGIWGLAASTALENLPVELRGLGSGIVQQGYACGYLFASMINLTIVPHSSHSWRTLFWTAACLSSTTALLRAITPESAIFLRAKALEKANGTSDTGEKTKIFIKETKAMLKTHWKLCIYAVLLMTGFNFLSHGSQDLYPTYLETSKGFSSHSATIATMIGNSGAITGGAIAGWASQYIGRRLTIVIAILVVGAFIPLWILPTSFSGLAAGAFCVQFGVQGAWGVVPIQLAEMSPPAFRATFPGVAYQLGNMISAASAQIEAIGGNNIRTTIVENGVKKNVPDYATVQGILIGVVAAYLICITILGPENHASHFEEAKTAFEKGAGQDEMQENGRPQSIRELGGKEVEVV
ncbi:major facilitator superfamily domain-containing protein [Scleroderma yunnanense]